jgi:hypothetical protein
MDPILAVWIGLGALAGLSVGVAVGKRRGLNAGIALGATRVANSDLPSVLYNSTEEALIELISAAILAREPNVYAEAYGTEGVWIRHEAQEPGLYDNLMAYDLSLIDPKWDGEVEWHPAHLDFNGCRGLNMEEERSVCAQLMRSLPAGLSQDPTLRLASLLLNDRGDRARAVAFVQGRRTVALDSYLASRGNPRPTIWTEVGAFEAAVSIPGR